MESLAALFGPLTRSGANTGSPTPQASPGTKEEGNKAPTGSAMARGTSRLSLDDGPIESRLGPVPEGRERLVAEIPESVLRTAGCVRTDEDSEKGCEWAGPGFATEE
ncbi:uncharacterized protein N7459_004662 [Penicillium hispanicum]|uniref:uncharacterized protein n=1 Tax=Penicillium hispanicum TaxID=1080232 RepID=UPI002540D60E|nr:uncharacterized protein N7459_004662 [Penicillium hispanicum]KAJ5584862.1 hypothetical protein N7459_004662 [Penicillium hispanicum]